jgi:molybdate transport system ATP-binding protein
MDEPLGSLDEGIKDRILPYLLRIRDEFHIPMVYVSHAAREIVALCHEVAILSNGKITAQGLPVNLFVATDEPLYRLRTNVSEKK